MKMCSLKLNTDYSSVLLNYIIDVIRLLLKWMVFFYLKRGLCFLTILSFDRHKMAHGQIFA